MMLLKTVVILLFSLLFFISASAFDSLQISAVLDTSLKQISGVVEYKLPEVIGLETFEFQLFPNVYASADSPYLVGKSSLREHLINSKKWGSMAIDSILINEINIGTDFTVDYTKGIVVLEKYSENLSPIIKLYFKTLLPESGDRLSHNLSNYLLNGWFPTPAVLNSDGEWYHPEYSRNSELVGDYFVYEVNISVPDGFIVASPGRSLIEETKNKENTEYRFQFGPAIDFALAIDPDYLIDESIIGNNTIRIYYRGYEYPIVSKIRNAVHKSIMYMNSYVGDYEYGCLNIAFSDIGFSGGIEFPGLISLSTPRGAPTISNAYDMLTIHEVVHQWFYGMVGSNQVEYPWLDESVTNFFTQKIFVMYWGESANFFDLTGFRVTMRDMNRLNAAVYRGDATINQPSYSYHRGNSYFSTIYDRGALAVETLDNLMGDSLSNIFWKVYFDKYKFAHPQPDDFRQIVIETAGESLAGIYDILIESAIKIDYSVTDLVNSRFDSTDTEISFVLHREGGINYQIDYRIYLSNGDSLDYKWNSKYNTDEIRHQSSFPAVSVLIDPDNKWAIDSDLLNNSVTIDPDNKPGFRLSAGIMFLIESLFSIVGGM